MLADRVTSRNNGIKCNQGDKISYVYIEVDDEKYKLQGDKIETPEYVKENNLRINYRFYITNQIMNPICQLYSLIYDNPKIIFEDILNEIDLKRNKTMSIENWLE